MPTLIKGSCSYHRHCLPPTSPTSWFTLFQPHRPEHSYCNIPRELPRDHGTCRSICREHWSQLRASQASHSSHCVYDGAPLQKMSLATLPQAPYQPHSVTSSVFFLDGLNTLLFICLPALCVAVPGRRQAPGVGHSSIITTSTSAIPGT